MPYADDGQKRRYGAAWIAARRAAIMARHCCPCGRPATRILPDRGNGKMQWSASEERIEEQLAARRLRCDDCARRDRAPTEAEVEARIERQRESNRAYMARRRSQRREAAPEPTPAPAPARAATETERRKRAAAPRIDVATVFDDPAWRRERAEVRQRRRAALGMAVPVRDGDD